MSTKESLLTAALLGTEKQMLPEFAGSTGELSSCLSQVKSGSRELGRERSLLHSAAMIYLVEKAGRNLEKTNEALCAPSLAETKSIIPADASRIMRAVLDSRQDLLPEFLQLIGQYNKRVPDDCLIGILQMAAQHVNLRPAGVNCMGTRAQWLAQFNPDWSFVDLEAKKEKKYDVDDLKKTFELGSIDERAWALAELRRIDPQQGLDILSSTWKTDRPEDRARFLGLLETRLSMHDEPFLESEALDDKRKEVRLQARERLLSLPQSRLSQRARSRAFACIAKEKAEFGLSNLLPFNKKKAQLTVTPPEACDKEMLRDGIVAKPTDASLGEKAWWLCQIVEQVDPRELLKHLELNAEQLLEAISTSEWQAALRRGLSEAVVRYRDRELAMLFLQAGRIDNEWTMFAILEPAQQEAVLTQALESRGFLLIRPLQNFNEKDLAQLLIRMKYMWSANFSRTILKTIRTHMTQKNNYIFMEYIMWNVAKNLDLEAWEPLAESWATTASYDPTLERLIATLSFRKEMRDAISKES